MLRRLKQIFRYFRNKSKFRHLKVKVSCKKKWFGNDYGGFYVNPILLNKESVVYSFGIGEDISFDLEMIEMFNLNVFGFDFTPRSIDWIKKNNISKNFKFFDYGIGIKSENVKFYLPKNENHVSGSLISQSNVKKSNSITVEVKSLTDIANENNHKVIDVLKLDIEGFEYELFENINFTKLQINQILVEFHERFFENGAEKTLKIINKLSLEGYEIFAISNSFEEISFIKVDLI